LLLEVYPLPRTHVFDTIRVCIALREICHVTSSKYCIVHCVTVKTCFTETVSIVSRV
jgi:hypothetical protein